MHRLWKKYQNDPAIAPLIIKHRVAARNLQDLRLTNRVDDIITAARAQQRLYNSIFRRIGKMEEEITERRWGFLSTVLTILLVLVGLINIAYWAKPYFS